MNLFPDLLPLAFVGALSVGLAIALICFVVGVHSGDRAELDAAPGGPFARFAQRTAGLHVLNQYDKG
jgi:hypothetical protein